jgi:DNA-binding NtrC family response regulator
VTLNVYRLSGPADAVALWVDVLTGPLAIEVREQSAERAVTAVWRGEPFLVAGTRAAVDNWLESHDDGSSKSMLMDSSYWWVLTRDSDYHHKLLPDNRVAVLSWQAREHNVVCHAMDRLADFPRLAGLSNRMDHLREQILLVAEGEKGPSNSVLILGPTGSGKEEVAQSIFAKSNRARNNRLGAIGGSLLNTMDPAIALIELLGVGPRVFQNMDERPGLVEIFSDGALFIDDFESAPRNVQEVLLRIMTARPGTPAAYRRHIESEDRYTNVWMIFATNADVGSLIEKERLREDFLFRFEDALVVPSLRKRPSDIPAIAYQIWKALHSVGGTGDIPVLSWRTIRELVSKAFQWEGNVRQLQMLLKLAAKMKRQMAHRNWSVGAVVEEITSRGPTFKDWLGVLGSDVYTGAPRPPKPQTVATIVAMDKGPTVGDLTPCQVEIQRRLGAAAWRELDGVAKKKAASKPERQPAVRKRLCRYLLFAADIGAITKADAVAFGDVGASQVAIDLELLANGGKFLHLVQRKPDLRYVPGSYFGALDRSE